MDDLPLRRWSVVTGLFNRIEHHHGNLARGRFLLIFREMRGPLLLPAPDHVAFGRLGQPRPDAEGLGTDLDGRVRMGEQVVIPGRVLRRPRLRREDREALPYPLERERTDSLGAGASPGMVQKYEAAAQSGRPAVRRGPAAL